MGFTVDDKIIVPVLFFKFGAFTTMEKVSVKIEKHGSIDLFHIGVKNLHISGGYMSKGGRYNVRL